MILSMGTDHTYFPYSTSPADDTPGYLWQHVLPMLAGLPDGASILDLGCGNGLFAKRLVELGYRVHGIDLEPSAITAAAQVCPASVFSLASGYDDLTSLSGYPFDAVLSLEVIEHLYRPQVFMQRVHECLTPGGLFVVSTPYHGYLKNLALAVTGKMDQHYTALWEGGHIKFWSQRTLTRLVESAGFVPKGFVAPAAFRTCGSRWSSDSSGDSGTRTNQRAENGQAGPEGLSKSRAGSQHASVDGFRTGMDCQH